MIHIFGRTIDFDSHPLFYLDHSVLSWEYSTKNKALQVFYIK
jgi:hypothetical protein